MIDQAKARPLYFREAQWPVDLTLTENPVGCSARVRSQHLNLAHLPHYPASSHRQLCSALQEKWQISSQMLVIGAGIDGLLYELANALLNAGDRVVVMQHGFPKMEYYASARGVTVVRAPMTADFRIDFSSVIAAVTPETKLIFICNPNNPTGLAERAGSIVELCKNIGRTTVVVDEASGEYIDDSVIRYVHELPNLLVLRTFSKVYGLPSIRVGYAIGNSAIAPDLFRARPRFPIGDIAAQMALMALTDKEHVRASIELVRKENEYLQTSLRELGFDVVPANTNCFIARIPASMGGADRFHSELEKKGAAVVAGANFGLEPAYIRIAPRLRPINDAFLRIVMDLKVG